MYPIKGKFLQYSANIFFLLLYCSARSQNGKIIDKQAFIPADSLMRNMEDNMPGIGSIAQKVNFYHVTYLSDGLKVKAYMAIPKTEGRYPCVLYNRGGNREGGKNTDESFIRNLAPISSEGYVIVASQYRGNDGGEGKEEFGGAEVNDILNLIPLLDGLKQADTSRIGMFGWSRGGMMTYLSLTKTSRIKAAVVGSGVTDLIKALETRPDFDTAVYGQLIPNYMQGKEAALKARSAVYFADKINRNTPILILQGTADWRVPANQVLDLVSHLYQLKQPMRFILYEGGQHSLVEHRADYLRQVINWFNAYLRDGKKWPSLEQHGN